MKKDKIVRGDVLVIKDGNIVIENSLVFAIIYNKMVEIGVIPDVEHKWFKSSPYPDYSKIGVLAYLGDKEYSIKACYPPRIEWDMLTTYEQDEELTSLVNPIETRVNSLD